MGCLLDEDPGPSDERAEPPELERLQGRLRELQRRLREVHRELARRPAPGGPVEQELQRLLAARGALVEALGAEILRLLARGGELSWHAAEPDEESRGTRRSAGERSPERSPEPTAPGASPGAIDPALLGALLDRLGPPAGVETHPGASREVARISAAIAEIDAWLSQPRLVRQALVGLVSSRARHLQDESGFGLAPEEAELLRSAFSEMTAWSREHQPGFVPGLSRHNPPKGDSWLHDARQWWHALETFLADAIPQTNEGVLERLEHALAKGPSRRQLRVRVREAVRAGLSPDDPRLVRLLLPHHEDLIGMRGLDPLKDALRRALGSDRPDPG
ncbi:MAG TPA: hypothetical protein ENK18_19760 [Deltaproteobacteria bacterium]|nr:hypothetical protein [Deltaproteobacteria bacterium]